MVVWEKIKIFVKGKMNRNKSLFYFIKNRNRPGLSLHLSFSYKFFNSYLKAGFQIDPLVSCLKVIPRFVVFGHWQPLCANAT